MDILKTFSFCAGLLLCVQSLPQSSNRLNEMISHYEPVYYDRVAFHENHHRTKRSTDATLHLNVKAFGETFNIRLRRDLNSVAQDILIENSKGRVHYSPDFTYTGFLEGVPLSSVYGVVTKQGLFEGTIRTETVVYRIEQASQYDLEGAKREDFHSIIYRDIDIDYHKIKTPSACESDAFHRKVKEKFVLGKKSSNPDTKEEKESEDVADNDAQKENVPKYDHVNEDGKTKYFNDNLKFNAHHRSKRAVDKTKKQCTLYVQAGHKYYQYWKTEEAVLEQISQHVQAVNDIYKLIDFDTNGSPEDITFIVKRIKIWTDSTDSNYRFAGNYAVETFLTMFSDNSNFDDYCLAYIFTYRDYDGGTLGLAWTGSTSSAGGVCERMGTFSGVQKSLNAGLVSILNYGQVQPQEISVVTFAHEIGHNFGSPHDTEGDAQCAPGGSVGNYIMYPKAHDGNKANNNKFSACSISNMWPVVAAKAMDDANGCFQIPATTICGNGLVEAGEDCDCGYDTDCTDTCCNPQVSAGGSSSGTPCTLKAGAQCSPSQGFCCGSNCQLTSEASNTTCRDATGCLAEATCNGVNTTCPASVVAADGTKCSASKVCENGACTGSLCLIYSMVQCQCSPATAGDFTDAILCQLCCAPNGTSNSNNCTSSYSLASMPNTEVDSGTICNNFEGYCDVFHKCRAVVPDGILSQLLNLNSLKDWLQSNWYFPVAGAVVFIILMIIMIKCCTPKKKSDKTKEDKKKDKKKSKVSPKKGPARRDQALTPPKAKPYKVYDNQQPGPYPGYDPYAGAAGQPPYGQMPPGGMPYGQMPPGGAMPYGQMPPGGAVAPYGAGAVAPY